MTRAIVIPPDDVQRESPRGPAGLFAASRRSTAWAAGYLYAAVHGLYMAVVLTFLAAYKGMSPAKALDRWDGLIYVRIAAHGYERHFVLLPNGRPARMDIAFFPLYPYLMRAVSTVTRMPYEASGVVISVLAGIAAAVGIAVLVEPRLGRRSALLSVALWAVGVDAMIQSMVYVQALIAALAVWTVVALVRGRRLTALVLVLLAGLCHSTAAALVLTVMAAGVLELVRISRGTAARSVRSIVGAVGMVVVAPLGVIAYWVFLAVRFHRWDTWFYAESAPGWNSKVDLGKYSLKTLVSQLDGSDFGHGRVTEAHLIATLWIVPAILIGLYLLRDLLRERRLPWQLAFLTLAALALPLLDSGPWASKPRFLIPAVGLVVPPAMWLARRTVRIQTAALIAVGAVSVLSSAFLIGVSPVAP
jgi:hypothetical protein